MTEDINITHKREVESGDFAASTDWNDFHQIEDFAIQENHLENEILIPDHFSENLIRPEFLDHKFFSHTSPHTAYADGLDDEEVFRIQVPSGTRVNLQTLMLQRKGSNEIETNFQIDVYHVEDSDVLETVNAGEVKEISIARDGSATIIGRISNSTGDEAVGSYTAQFYYREV